MSTASRPESPPSIPIFDFFLAGQTVCLVYFCPKIIWDEAAPTLVRLDFDLVTVPVTRLGRTLPDWPRALSLRPDLSERAN